MNTAAPRSEAPQLPSILADSTGVPWRNLTVRIRTALSQRDYYVASSEDLRVLWQGEKVDLAERRRRIMVFAAQHDWKVETQTDGTSARFHHSPPSGIFSRESLSRNHE